MAAFRSDESTDAEEIPVVFKLPEKIERRSADAIKALLLALNPDQFEMKSAFSDV